MKKLLSLFFISTLLSSCSMINYRLALRDQEKQDFNKCYKETHSYNKCKKDSYELMNKRHETIISIKDKHNL